MSFFNKSFIKNPFISDTLMYKTGDLGMYNENGEIMVADSSPVEGMVTGNSLYSEYYECDLFNTKKLCFT